METKSLKALAQAVLERNQQGNHKETKKETMETIEKLKETKEDKYSNNNNRLNKVSIITPYGGKPGNSETFKDYFDRLAGYLRQRKYTPENMARLQELALAMDSAWNRLDYPSFKKVADDMKSIPGILRPEAGQPYATRIYSKILNEEVWVVTDPEAISYVPDGAVVYTPDEIRNLKGASPDEIRTIYSVKKELCSVKVTH